MNFVFLSRCKDILFFHRSPKLFDLFIISVSYLDKAQSPKETWKRKRLYLFQDL